MTLHLLDTNTVSYIVKGKSSTARARLASLSPGETACISSITEAELLYGIAKAGVGEERKKSLDWFLNRLKVWPWGRQEAAVYGTLRARQEALGKTLGPLDTLIAAHAISLEAVLVTSDRAFHQVQDLITIENWATDL